MKKKLTILFLGLLILSVMPFVVAEDDEVADEINRMGTHMGSQHRFDVLVASLENQIDTGKDLLTELDENVSDEVADELAGYVEDLEDLLVRARNIDTSRNPSELAAEFLSIKKEAQTISMDYKKLYHSTMRSARIAEIKAKFTQRMEERKTGLHERLMQKKEDAYAKRMSGLLNKLGVEDEDIWAKYENGVMTKDDVKNLIKTKMNSLSNDERKELRADIAKTRNESLARSKEMRENVKDRIQEKIAQMKADREEKRTERKAQFQERIQQHKENMEMRKAEIKENINNKMMNKGKR